MGTGTNARPTRDAIVDAALALAEQTSWERIRLHQVAERLGAGLDEIRVHFREKEDIVDAWFDRADSAMLRAAEDPAWESASPRERLERALLAWLDALAGHRRVTRQMILNKLELGHVHYQYAGLVRVSRTVQWWREAALRTAALPWRAIEETVLTGIYLATFTHWLWDDSSGAQRTRAFLARQLARARFAGEAPAPSAPPRESGSTRSAEMHS